MHKILIIINDTHAKQRLDNFLITRLKDVPASRIYRAIRNGEVRVNKRRMDVDYRLAIDDLIQIPPLQIISQKKILSIDRKLIISLEMRILYEEENLLVINKPAGFPVHGNRSNVDTHAGLIEVLRIMRPKARLLELVHRLDRETSGCLIVAKKRATLVTLHALLMERKVEKQYFLLVKGRWTGGVRHVEEPLKKHWLHGKEKIVKVEKKGKPSVTIFRLLKIFSTASLIEAKPLSGRTHQIRVHAAHIGYPIAGDEKYGDKNFNREMRKYGLRRLFLHASGIYCQYENRQLGICAILDTELKSCLTQLNFFPPIEGKML